MSSLVGKTLGSYKLEAALGKGGMATVFRAFQASVRRPVAIKVMAPEVASQPGFMERFVQEAQVIASLEHPQILPVFDYGEADGLHYIVMRLVDGGSLDDRIMARQLAFGEISHYLMQIAAALDYAHKRGVIHRDLKPNNVLLDSENNVYLTDFGIARLAGGDRKLTATGSVIGTPAYISPEQGMGRPVDARSDVYSLGILLYEMLTQQLPFQADTPAALIFLHVYEQPHPATEYRTDLPATVVSVLDKALAKRPEARYPTAGELALAFTDAAGVRGNSTRPAMTPPPPISTPPPVPTDERTIALSRTPPEQYVVPVPQIPVAAEHEPTLVDSQAVHSEAVVAAPTPIAADVPVDVNSVVDNQMVKPSTEAVAGVIKAIPPSAAAPDNAHTLVGNYVAPLVADASDSVAATVLSPERRRRVLIRSIAAILLIILGVGVFVAIRPIVIQQRNLAWTPVFQMLEYDGYSIQMVYVPEGTFTMGEDKMPGTLRGDPASPQTISRPFWLDTREVSEAQYKKLNDNITGSSKPYQPHRFVSWEQAATYCREKRDGFLPTEAQWEWAARGPRSLRYPWGNDWDPTKVVMNNDQSTPPDVGSKRAGASWVGALDMSGGVKEWTSSKLRLYPYNATDGREDPLGSYENRVIRGGSWLSPDATYFLSAYRFDWGQQQSNGEVGFRCAKWA